MAFGERTLLCLAAASPAAAQSAAARWPADCPDMKEILSYRLSLDKVQRFVDGYKVRGKDRAAAVADLKSV